MGPMNLKIELGRDFSTVHLPTKFHHPAFNHLKVIVLLNIQRTKEIPSHMAPLCYAGGE